MRKLLAVVVALLALLALVIVIGLIVFGLYKGAELAGLPVTPQDGLNVPLITAALGGLISFLSPCVLPLVPPYLGFLGGTSVDAASADDGGMSSGAYMKVILAALFFILGFTTVFVALGATATALFQMIAPLKYWFTMIAGGVIIIFGLHFIGLIRIPLLYRQARFEADVKSASMASAYLMGLAFAFGWTPCVGPVLSAIIVQAGNEATVMKGAGLLLVYSMGLGIPFFLAAVLIQPFMTFFRKFRKHLETVELAMGVLLIVTGILFLTNSMNVIGTWMLNNLTFLQGLG